MGNEGVLHLSKGNWKRLKTLYISILFMIKETLNWGRQVFFGWSRETGKEWIVYTLVIFI
jgi:hypothetical protein